MVHADTFLSPLFLTLYFLANHFLFGNGFFCYIKHFLAVRLCKHCSEAVMKMFCTSLVLC